MEIITFPELDGKIYEAKIWSQRRKEYDVERHCYQYWGEILHEIDGGVWKTRVWGREKREEESLDSDSDRTAFEVESDC